MNARSLRFQLIVWYAGLLTGVFLLFGALMFFGLKHFLEGNLEESQSRRARQIGETLLAKVNQTGEAYVVEAIKSRYAPELNDRFIRVTRSDGRVLYTSGVPKDQSFDPTHL